MTSRPPTRRLVDVLKQNSKATLDRHAAQLAAAASSLPAEAIQNRFLRNKFLINPKAVHLLSTDEHLMQWHTFAVYKPPFCPMRRSEATDNYHGVSIESFVESALQSRDVYPILRRILTPSEVHVRVLYNLDIFASGPVLISVSDVHRHATSLQTTTMEYDVLVSGHLPLHAVGNHTDIEAAELFPEASASSTSGTPGGNGESTACALQEVFYEVKRNGYYSVHPVSLLHITIRGPPTAQPPGLERFVREKLGTCVIGDPLVTGELTRVRARPTPANIHASAKSATTNSASPDNRSLLDDVSTSSRRDSAAYAAAMKLTANPHIVSRRGDFNFPRVFVHLREVRIDTSADQPSISSTDGAPVPHSGGKVLNLGVGQSRASSLAADNGHGSAQSQEIRVHCRKCFDGLLQQQLSSSFKSRRISLLDGTWTPQAEFL